MLNQVMLIGRLVNEIETNDNVSMMTLAVPRNYKNEFGVYETDFIDCQLWGGIATSTIEYCKKGDLIGVRGKIQTKNIETSDGEKKKTTYIVAEKISFLSSDKINQGE